MKKVLVRSTGKFELVDENTFKISKFNDSTLSDVAFNWEQPRKKGTILDELKLPSKNSEILVDDDITCDVYLGIPEKDEILKKHIRNIINCFKSIFSISPAQDLSVVISDDEVPYDSSVFVDIYSGGFEVAEPVGLLYNLETCTLETDIDISASLKRQLDIADRDIKYSLNVSLAYVIKYFVSKVDKADLNWEGVSSISLLSCSKTSKDMKTMYVGYKYLGAPHRVVLLHPLVNTTYSEVSVGYLYFKYREV